MTIAEIPKNGNIVFEKKSHVWFPQLKTNFTLNSARNLMPYVNIRILCSCVLARRCLIQFLKEIENATGEMLRYKSAGSPVFCASTWKPA